MEKIHAARFQNYESRRAWMQSLHRFVELGVF